MGGIMPTNMPGAPKGGTYNSYGSGGAGSYNYGRKKRDAQFPPIFAPSLGGMNFNNFGQGGAGSNNYGTPSMPMGGMPSMPSRPIFAPSLGGTNFNNFGQGGAGSHNLDKRETRYIKFGSEGAGHSNFDMPMRRKRVAPMVMFENLVYGISGRNVLLKKN